MKIIYAILLCMMCSIVAHASHIIGGQVYYKFLERTGNMLTYQVSMKLYRICGSADKVADMPNAIILAAFDKDNNNRVDQYTIQRSSFEIKNLTQFDPCIVNPPPVCFQVGLFETNITLPLNAAGYTIAFQSCCRDPFMINIVAEPIPGGNTRDLGTGATYFIDIPGSNSGAENNSSPTFNKEEATLVCADKRFTYDFSASDIDGDQLTYEFCDAYKGGDLTPGTGIPPAAVNPPYNFVSYVSPYNGQAPLGPNVSIDPNTGIISGIAPAAGKYVVTVCVNEYRHGKKIGTLRKDFHINVTTCVKQVTASMPEKYTDCSSFTIHFINNSTRGKPYHWDFDDGHVLDTNSTDPVSHTYSKTGTYKVKLYVDKNSNCGDSALATAYVYPIFKPGFSVTGMCANKATDFKNLSRSDAGPVDYYKWDFGNGDTSNATNPTYYYKSSGNYAVKLYAHSVNGCVQTVTQSLAIYDKPSFNATNDTLICAKDSLQMWASSNLPGKFTWAPANYYILHPTTPTPIVYPPEKSSYTITFEDLQGCKNDKNITVDVKNSIFVQTISDSTMCTGDKVHLSSVTDGKYDYRWRNLELNQVISTTADAYVLPAPPKQSYEIQVTLGKCWAADTVNLKIVDPPSIAVAPDTVVCYGSPITLRATGGAFYRWSPAYYVDNAAQPISIAHPRETMHFTVTVTDTLGCTKAVTDSVLIKVVPPVQAFAGNDTIVMLHTPFQLHATGGIRYAWTPADGLNYTNINNPITTVDRDISYIVTAYTEEGCNGTDTVSIRFITGPNVYIPNAFSPNGDGNNDVFRPLPVGMIKINFFRVFDRWGRLMFSTTAYLKGWDGTIDGQPAAAGAYVYIMQGVDINNKTIIKKGTVTLVR